ncbi:uncharacterized protein LOC118736556 isoform X2 [Rhagoletis pomonella]|uniref:uncharacterized protein LOC118736556 isoform X2 n=1 Tax=Rhagoletis pomonella TaxID=28610 RepID=UPI00177D096F|nr:uncharacterized protein LOC118736556 isoform X2 [Rhagoletis pomonella]
MIQMNSMMPGCNIYALIVPKNKDVYDFIEKARRADNELRCTQTEKVKIESIANTFEWVPVHEELMEVTKMPDTDHVEDIKVSPEWNEHFMDDDETSASNDIEHEINIDKKLSTDTTTTKFLVESDKDMQSGNNLNEAGLVLSKKSKQLNPKIEITLFGFLTQGVMEIQRYNKSPA